MHWMQAETFPTVGTIKQIAETTYWKARFEMSTTSDSYTDGKMSSCIIKNMNNTGIGEHY